jgi:hypothetical protein
MDLDIDPLSLLLFGCDEMMGSIEELYIALNGLYTVQYIQYIQKYILFITIKYIQYIQ